MLAELNVLEKKLDELIKHIESILEERTLEKSDSSNKDIEALKEENRKLLEKQRLARKKLKKLLEKIEKIGV